MMAGNHGDHRHRMCSLLRLYLLVAVRVCTPDIASIQQSYR